MLLQWNGRHPKDFLCDRLLNTNVRCANESLSCPFFSPICFVCRYKLASGGAFNSLVKVSLKYVKPLLDHHLPVAHAKTGKGAPLPMTSKGWKKLRAPIKVYLNSVAQLMSQLTDADAQNFVLHYDRALCPYYACESKNAPISRPALGCQPLEGFYTQRSFLCTIAMMTKIDWRGYAL
jgi:hypothetical protein